MTNRKNRDLKVENVELQIAAQEWEDKYIEAMKRPVCSGRCASMSSTTEELHAELGAAIVELQQCAEARDAMALEAQQMLDRAEAADRELKKQEYERVEAMGIAGSAKSEAAALRAEDERLRAELSNMRDASKHNAGVADYWADQFTEVKDQLAAANAQLDAANAVLDELRNECENQRAMAFGDAVTVVESFARIVAAQPKAEPLQERQAKAAEAVGFRHLADALRAAQPKADEGRCVKCWRDECQCSARAVDDDLSPSARGELRTGDAAEDEYQP